MSEQQTERLDTWGLLDLMGHVRVAGRISEATIAGGAFIRIDVPAVGEDVAHTRYFGPSAIYSISPCTEEVARAMAASLRQRPVQQYELPKLEAPDVMPERLARRICANCGQRYALEGGLLCSRCQEVADDEANREQDDEPYDEPD